MKTRNPRLLSLLAGTSLVWAFTGWSAVSVGNLRCEYAENPLGIDIAKPRLSWTMESSARGQRQAAYQVLVASSADKLRAGQGDLWDSGKVTSDHSIQVAYAGAAMSSRQICHWKVRVWDENGKMAESGAAQWEMGLLESSDWLAEWIGFSPESEDAAPSFEGAKWLWYPEGNPASNAPRGDRFFRREFELPGDAKIKSAQMILTVDDQYTVYVNGEETGKSSGKVDAWKEVKTFDLKARLHPGRNVLAVKAHNDASAAGLLAKLVIQREGGTPLAVTSDRSWKVANQVEEGWLKAETEGAGWVAAKEIAKFGEGPWQSFGGSKKLGQCPHLRKTVRFSQPVKKARLYASALGLYEFSINGQRVGNDCFNPSWTDYKKRVQYHVYDVTSLLREGENALGLILGDGWYAGYVGLGGPHRYGPAAQALAQIEVELADGNRQTVLSGASWKAAQGPILQSDLLMGEIYDARKELTGWNKPGFDDSKWKPATVAKPAVRLVAAADAPVRRMLELKALTVAEPKPGRFVFDLGQNMVGWARLKVKGTPGQTVTLRFAEMLNPDGTIYTTNLRGAKATDQYTLKGEGEEVFEPRFTFHGFRYIELSGYPGRPGLEAVTGVVAYSDTPAAGHFECSKPIINQLYSNIVWGQRGNFLAVPTDCPQRDERLGWMGDAQIFIRTATWNMDVSRFFTKWCQDVEDAQRPDGAFTDVSPFVCCGAGTAAWGDAGVICPWTIYRVYGDERILERHYAAGARWIEYLAAHSKGLLRPAEGYGDWLSIRADTPKDVLATAYFALSTRIMANMATTLGRTGDAAKYEDLFGQIKAAFRKAYVAPDGRIKGNTQTDYVLALAFDLLPGEQRGAAAKRLVEDIEAKGGHLSTGFVGVGHLNPTLTREGYVDVAYGLLNQDTFPGWLYSVKNGATTIWERWDGWTKEKGFQDPGMNSFNHYSLGSVGEWLFETVAGIGMEPQSAAYKRIVIRPRPGGGLDWARADYRSMHGKIASEWRIKEGRFELRTVIPANTTALVYVPSADLEAIQETDRPASQAEGLKFLRTEEGAGIFAVGSGSYRFAAPWK